MWHVPWGSADVPNHPGSRRAGVMVPSASEPARSLSLFTPVRTRLLLGFRRFRSSRLTSLPTRGWDLWPYYWASAWSEAAKQSSFDTRQILRSPRERLRRHHPSPRVLPRLVYQMAGPPRARRKFFLSGCGHSVTTGGPDGLSPKSTCPLTRDDASGAWLGGEDSNPRCARPHQSAPSTTVQATGSIRGQSQCVREALSGVIRTLP